MINKERYLSELENLLIEKKRGKYYQSLCLHYAKRLLDNNLPVIFDVLHLSMLLGASREAFLAEVFSPEDYLYRTISIPKKTGGFRTINAPSENLKYVQRWIIDNILSNIPVSEHSTAFKSGCSIVKNAEAHLNNDCLLNIDLKNFFPTISSDTIFRLFHYYGYSKEISFILTKICTYKGFLPQGSPASPYLANICCIKLDKRISELCKQYSATYTRYADDLTISGNDSIINCLPIVNAIVEDEGFIINTKKTHVAHRHQRQCITGLIINSGEIHVPKAYKRQIFTEIYFMLKHGVTDHLEHIGSTKSFYKEHIYGKAYFIYMVEQNTGKKLLNLLNSINWDY